ncbi:MAG TPA: hypothetical protein VER55_07045 [Ardenticatenaceae bacterium]|nr:hypothetical protein [Ardenticatenaceae bacterium]
MQRLFVLFPLGIAVLAALAPLPKLFTIEAYRGPLDFLSDRRTLFDLYNATVAALALLYVVLFVTGNRPAFNIQRLVDLSVFMLVVIAVSYPVVYDPLAYHYAVKLWLHEGINVYTEMLDAHKEIPFPVVSYPVNHNYHRGPIWLLLTSLVFVLTAGNFVAFLLALRLLAAGGLAAIIGILKRCFDVHLSPGELLFFLGFNPIVLIFLLNGGHQEALLSLLMLGSFVFARRQQVFAATLLLGLAALNKVSAWPLVLLLGAWLVGDQRDSRARIRAIGMMAAAALLIAIPLYLIFGFSPEYLSGVQQWTARERESFASLSGSIVLPLSHSGLTFDRDALRSVLRMGLYALNLGLVGLFSLQHLRGAKFETLARNSWLVLLLNPYLTDIGVRPWYLLPAVFLAPLLGQGERRLTAVVSSLAVLAGVPFSYVMFTHGQLRFLFYAGAQIVGHLLPTLLLLGYLLHAARSRSPRQQGAVSLPQNV